VLSQVALELFASAVLVDEEGRHTRRAFKNLDKTQSIRELLAWASIPAAIPDTCHDLKALAVTEGWSDGPATLVGYACGSRTPELAEPAT
jgi:hypothetical protein